MDSQSGHGLDPKSWGPHAWYMIHSLASMANTDQEKLDFVAYINAFAKVIPCSVCKKHFAENRQKFDIHNYMENAETLLMWTYIVHDAVNFAQKKTGSARPSWTEIRARYFKVDNNDKEATPGSSEDYDATICTEICGATVAKLRSKESSNERNVSAMKIKSARNNRK